jgi:APA family basic amino acid/polyamine antiporter
MAAAAIIFFAFYGFDAIATAAEEAKNPSRDLAIGIVGSMLVCVLFYMAVAAAAIGAVAYTGFANSAEPLALILRDIGQPMAARVLGAAAVISLPTVILAFFYGQSRIFFTVARDGLLPPSLARVSRRGTPVRITVFTAVVTSVFAGLIPLASIAALANAGTLAAFVAVCAAMLVLRRRDPTAERKFRTPAPWVVGLIGIGGCIYLFHSLPNRTQLFFFCAQAIGIVLYFIYGNRAAERARSGA